MAEELYRQLQERLNMYSLGFPATKSGIEIRIMQKLFNPEDAEIFLALSPKLEKPGDVAERIGKSAEEAAKILEDMARRGLLFRMVKDGTASYGAIPFMHGIMEFQVKRYDRELADMMEQYFSDGFHEAIAANAGLFLRTIPVGESVSPEYHVAAFEDAMEILRNAPVIAVSECICRKEKKTIGKGCDKPHENCFMFGSMARYYIDNGLGRQVGLEEAIEIVLASQKAGLVTQPGTAQNPAGMCNCCGDCCGVLAAVKRDPRPASLVFSNFQAAVAADQCSGCGACLDRCQMEALALDGNGTAEVNLNRCIGCGLCITECPTGALALAPRSGQERRVPPRTSGEQMMMIAKNRGIL